MFNVAECMNGFLSFARTETSQKSRFFCFNPKATPVAAGEWEALQLNKEPSYQKQAGKLCKASVLCSTCAFILAP